MKVADLFNSRQPLESVSAKSHNCRAKLARFKIECLIERPLPDEKPGHAPECKGPIKVELLCRFPRYLDFVRRDKERRRGPVGGCLDLDEALTPVRVK